MWPHRYKCDFNMLVNFDKKQRLRVLGEDTRRSALIVIAGDTTGSSLTTYLLSLQYHMAAEEDWGSGDIDNLSPIRGTAREDKKASQKGVPLESQKAKDLRYMSSLKHQHPKSSAT